MPVPWDGLSLVHPGRRRRSSAHSSAGLKRHRPSALAPFSCFNKTHVQVPSLHFSAEQHDLAQEPAGSVHLIPRKGRKQRAEAETPTNCIAETFNPKRCIFSQETVTHDLIFPGHKISKWFIWSGKNSPTIFHSGVMFISYWFEQFPVSTINSNSRWYSCSTKTLKLPFL